MPETETKTQPFSIRLRKSVDRLVADEMRRSGRSRSAVVEELAEEGAKIRLFPGIGLRGRPRRPWAIGSGLDIWEIIEMLRSYENDEDELRKHHPLVTARHIQLARAYAEHYPDEIEAALEANNPPLEELRERYPFVRHAR